ncbi:Alcohol dehydrogenase [Chondromyces apiculatus DSM 436]|uniref:Alcohol dehydrogenase n=1 Tax=Chondromyces apiculatus DSM 436 TaxID=1192034 RepID=A0A017T0V2_9BACT|nr:Alcohol dehydrogenase [Chondromyces apiculatus DSM 436]
MASSATSGLQPGTIERREPGADDVVIDITHCGVCHTDLSQTRNEWGGSVYPLVPGHEIVGVVRAVGAAVREFRVGERVGVGTFVDGGHSLGVCAREHEHRDHKHFVPTYNGKDHEGRPTYGGYAQSIVVKQGYVLHIPDGVPSDAAAPLLCAGITMYSPLRHWKAGPGKKVAVVGLGGLGHIAVKMAHAMGAEVTVLSQSLSKQADGARLGADHFHATSDPETFKKLADTFDLILVTVGATLDWNAYIGLLRMDGALVLLGIPSGPGSVDAFPLIASRKTLSGSGVGSIPECQEMLAFCAKHGIVSDIETIPIQQIESAFERLARGDVRYRFVIDMASLGK